MQIIHPLLAFGHAGGGHGGGFGVVILITAAILIFAVCVSNAPVKKD